MMLRTSSVAYAIRNLHSVQVVASGSICCSEQQRCCGKHTLWIACARTPGYNAVYSNYSIDGFQLKGNLLE